MTVSVETPLDDEGENEATETGAAEEDSDLTWKETEEVTGMGQP
jgi:hypothetical protein